MKPVPADWTRISSALFYDDPRAAIDFLAAAFGFEVRTLIEDDDGRVLHSELTYGGAVIMVGGIVPAHGGPSPRRSPRSIGGANTQSLMVYVDDADEHCANAREAGATIVSEPKTTDYGERYWVDRGYEAEDLEGHRWWFVARVRDASK